MIEAFQKSFDAFVETNRKEHREIIVHQKETNGRVNKNEKWRLENKEIIETIKSERKNTRQKVVDYAWKIGVAVLLILLGINKLKGGM